MAGRIPQPFIDELIARADIVEIVGSRVPLKKAGREYKACCPFHDEKTASFWVSPDKQFYHCFGCGAHGTALGFLMQYDQLPFPEAVEELAGAARARGAARRRRRGARRAPRKNSANCSVAWRASTRSACRSTSARGAYLRGRGLDAGDHRALPASATRPTPGTKCCAASAPPTKRGARCSPPG